MTNQQYCYKHEIEHEIIDIYLSLYDEDDYPIMISKNRFSTPMYYDYSSDSDDEEPYLSDIDSVYSEFEIETDENSRLLFSDINSTTLQSKIEYTYSRHELKPLSKIKNRISNLVNKITHKTNK